MLKTYKECLEFFLDPSLQPKPTSSGETRPESDVSSGDLLVSLMGRFVSSERTIEFLDKRGFDLSHLYPVSALIQARRQIGLEKYNTELYANDGRNTFKDISDEFGDLFHYISKALIENKLTIKELHIIILFHSFNEILIKLLVKETLKKESKNDEL